MELYRMPDQSQATSGRVTISLSQVAMHSTLPFYSPLRIIDRFSFNYSFVSICMCTYLFTFSVFFCFVCHFQSMCVLI